MIMRTEIVTIKLHLFMYLRKYTIFLLKIESIEKKIIGTVKKKKLVLNCNIFLKKIIYSLCCLALARPYIVAVC